MAAIPIDSAGKDNPVQIGAATDGRARDQQRRGQAALDVALTALFIALLTGWIESVFWLIKQHAFGDLVFLHPGYAWMSPVSQLVLFAVPAMLLTIVAWRLTGREMAVFSVVSLSFLGWLNILLLIPGLHLWGWILAAAGLATATGRLFRSRPQPCLRWMKLSIVPMLVPMLLLPVAQSMQQQRRESAALAALPTPDAHGPNVLLIVLDTARVDALELYGGDPRTTPHLTQLASQGVVFNQAWSTAPWTLPSQAGMFTGCVPHELSADWLSALDNRHPTLAEKLASRGWATAGFVGNTRYCSAETGLARGFCHYEDYRLSPGDFVLCTALGRYAVFTALPLKIGLRDWPGRKRAEEVSAGLLQWLDRRPRRPYFAFLNYFDAHDPYLPLRGYERQRPTSEEDIALIRDWWWTEKDNLSPDRIRMLRTAYEDCLRGLDAHLGDLLTELRRRGELDDTIVVITADHGEHFGRRGLFLHGNSLYEPLIHVPLLVIAPGRVPAGVRVEEPVSLSGLPNTVLELTGAVADLPGDSWVHSWDPESAGSVAESIIAEVATQPGNPPCHGCSPIAYGPMRCLRERDYKYIHRGDGFEELYDLRQDPQERQNLAYSEAHRTTVGRLREKLQVPSDFQNGFRQFLLDLSRPGLN